MIRGLRWSNVGWLTCFSLILIMTATAPGYLKLNYGLLVSIFEIAKSGGASLLAWQREAAQVLDQETQRRYGADPWAPIAIKCVTTALPNSATLQETDVRNLLIKPPHDRYELIKQFGEPYCRSVEAYDLWRISGNRILQVQYNPLKYQVKDSAGDKKR